MSVTWWRAETGFFLALWLYLSWLGQGQFLQDPGVFWSTVLGQHILERGAVPQAEEFSCTRAGQPWNSHQWLAQVVMALLHRLGGLDALGFAAAVLLASLYTWVAHRFLRAGLHWLFVVPILLLLVTASRYHFLARPLLASIVLLGWTFAQLVDCEAGKVPLRRLVWLPAVFVLWTNLHGGALGGLATVTLVFLGWLVAWPLGLVSPIRSRQDATTVLLILCVCFLATLVNPYGWQLPRDWLGLMGSPVLPKYINEHKPLDEGNPLHRAVLYFGLCYVIALLLIPSWRQLRVSWALPLVWLVLTIGRIRHCTLFAITTAVALAEVLPRTRPALALADIGSLWFVPPGSPNSRPPVSWQAFALPGALVLAGAVCLGAHWRVPYLGHGWYQTDPALIPQDLLPVIAAHSQPGDAIFNDLTYGGFLIYYAPQLRLFVDDRCELYGDQFLREFYETNTALLEAHRTQRTPPDQVEKWTETYGFKLALVVKTSGYDYYLASRPDLWQPLAETTGVRVGLPGAVLYERRAKQAVPEENTSPKR